jgi:hypothetical protein
MTCGGSTRTNLVWRLARGDLSTTFTAGDAAGTGCQAALDAERYLAHLKDSERHLAPAQLAGRLG